MNEARRKAQFIVGLTNGLIKINYLEKWNEKQLILQKKIRYHDRRYHAFCQKAPAVRHQSLDTEWRPWGGRHPAHLFQALQ